MNITWKNNLNLNFVCQIWIWKAFRSLLTILFFTIYGTWSYDINHLRFFILLYLTPFPPTYDIDVFFFNIKLRLRFRDSKLKLKMQKLDPLTVNLRVMVLTWPSWTVCLLLLILIFITCESYNSQPMIIDIPKSTVFLIRPHICNTKRLSIMLIIR